MVIVTQNQYIVAQKIHHITMDEQTNHTDVRDAHGRFRTLHEKYYQITVIYTPESTQSGQQRNDEMRECTVVLRGAVNAHGVFKELVEQIREQCPDQLYLNKALERMLSGMDEASIKDKDNTEHILKGLFGSPTMMKSPLKFIKRKKHVASAKKVRGTGKAKRAGKAVLRKSKARR